MHLNRNKAAGQSDSDANPARSSPSGLLRELHLLPDLFSPAKTHMRKSAHLQQ